MEEEDSGWIEEEMVNTLLSDNYEVFKHYFIDLSEEPHPDPAKADQAKTLFQKYHYPDSFEIFVAKFQTWCKKEKEKRLQTTESCSQTTETRPVQTEPSHWIETERQPTVAIDENQIFRYTPIVPRRVTVVPPFRKRKRGKEEFNAVDFLLQKKKSNEGFSLKFQSDEDVQEELLAVKTTEKKKMSLLTDGVLRKIAEQIELLNQLYDYRLLETCYER